MTHATRIARYRAAQKAKGGRQVNVLLSPEAAAKLDKLIKKHGSVVGAIEHAIKSA